MKGFEEMGSGEEKLLQKFLFPGRRRQKKITK